MFPEIEQTKGNIFLLFYIYHFYKSVIEQGESLCQLAAQIILSFTSTEAGNSLNLHAAATSWTKF